MTSALEQRDTAQIDAAISALVETWNQHDMAGYMKQFTKDADFVNVIGVRLRGYAEIESTHIKIHETIFRNSHIRSTGHAVRFLNDTTAVVHLTWEMHGGQGVEGWKVPEVRQGIFTLVMVRDNDAWRITAAQNTDAVNVSMAQLDAPIPPVPTHATR